MRQSHVKAAHIALIILSYFAFSPAQAQAQTPFMPTQNSRATALSGKTFLPAAQWMAAQGEAQRQTTSAPATPQPATVTTGPSVDASDTPLSENDQFMYQGRKFMALRPNKVLRQKKARGYPRRYTEKDIEQATEKSNFSEFAPRNDPFGLQDSVNPFFQTNPNAMPAGVPSQKPEHVGSMKPKEQSMFLPRMKQSEALVANVESHHSWPIDEAQVQRVSSAFGPREDPFTGNMAFHAGIDIAAKAGTPVKATMDGTVYATGEHPRLGRYVRIDHPDGTYSLYGHLRDWNVTDKQVVLKGETIGVVGSTGRSTGAHLDYSLRKDQMPMDPMKVLSIPDHLTTLEISSNH